MREKMTKKELYKIADLIIITPDLSLRGYEFPKLGANSGIYGWNWSAYDFGHVEGVGHVALVEGDRSFPAGDICRVQRDVIPDEATARQYFADLARKIYGL